jgi:hypothetical protein
MPDISALIYPESRYPEILLQERTRISIHLTAGDENTSLSILHVYCPVNRLGRCLTHVVTGSHSWDQFGAKWQPPVTAVPPATVALTCHTPTPFVARSLLFLSQPIYRSNIHVFVYHGRLSVPSRACLSFDAHRKEKRSLMVRPAPSTQMEFLSFMARACPVALTQVAERASSCCYIRGRGCPTWSLPSRPWD